MVRRSTTHRPVTQFRLIGCPSCHLLGRRPRQSPILSDESEHTAIHTKDQGVAGIAQARCILANRVQHRLQVCGRTRDYTQDLGGRRLLLQRLRDLRMGLGERPILGLQLPEQPHVLDGDDGLVGERVQQLDLFVGERVGLDAP